MTDSCVRSMDDLVSSINRMSDLGPTGVEHHNPKTGQSAGFETLVELLREARRLVVLTGAGCSTASGIPDYRSPGGAWTRHKPIYYSAFVRSEEVRRFYWARSFRGWPRFAAARPNDAHRALAALEELGRAEFLI